MFGVWCDDTSYLFMIPATHNCHLLLLQQPQQVAQKGRPLHQFNKYALYIDKDK